MNAFTTIRNVRLISIKLGAFHFNPGLISTLITIALLYTMISLGTWQLGRADFKATLQQNIEQRKNLIPVELENLSGSAEERRFRPVALNGIYDVERSFLLDNKTMHKRAGYHVYTPFLLSNGMAILVNRGYILQGNDRSVLPDVMVKDTEISITGLVDIEPVRGIQLTEYTHDSSSWPVVLQHVDLKELSQILGYQLYDMVLWLDKDKIGSFTYDMPVLNLNSAKNNGYAFQWFAMSLALLIIYLVVNTRKST